MHRIATSLWFGVAGLALAAYPVLRPWGDEADAETFAAASWPVSHALAMLGFTALALALRHAAAGLPQWGGRPVREAETRMWLAAALLLPYYGAEAYGLNAIGQYAAEHRDSGVLEIADAFRFAPLPVTTFALGLLLLVLVGARQAIGMWRTGALGRIGGLLAGFGLASYLPQFFGGAELRIVHGIVLGIGLLLVSCVVASGRQGATGDTRQSRLEECSA
ncbi:hypothetical protein [Nocardioides sp. AE5]|uniref:hypothetical protein n=1 Tax=Nocardioides sp. AE5 TaxID=2962573 RepID=UPI0028829228|nr:hypothetical protein [Nocardioides sp. AE5]MDT0202120.1 hypothetical protein [Nocardioides sp. AE5]